MQGQQKIIDKLNDALTIELTAINQYFIQSKMCKNWGYDKLAKKHYVESIGEMKHAEKIIDRILFLEGVPEIARYGVIKAGANVEDQFQVDLALETSGVKAYNELIKLCIDHGDHGTRDLVDPILAESEEHVDWLETQLGVIQAIGLQLYLADQLGDHGEGH